MSLLCSQNDRVVPVEQRVLVPRRSGFLFSVQPNDEERKDQYMRYTSIEMIDFLSKDEERCKGYLTLQRVNTVKSALNQWDVKNASLRSAISQRSEINSGTQRMP